MRNKQTSLILWKVEEKALVAQATRSLTAYAAVRASHLLFLRQ